MKTNMKNILLVIVLFIVSSVAVSAANQLYIDDIDAWVDGKSESGVSSSGGTIDGIKPESTVKITIDFKSNYDSNNGNLDLEDIDVEARILEIVDDGSGDLEADTYSISKISPGRKKSVTFEFKIPLEVEDQTYSLEITAEGDDENGTSQSVTETLDVEVEKNSHELRFYRTDISSEKICEGSTTLDVGLVNTGTNDEDVTLQIRNSELSLNDETKFTLDASPFDDTSKKLQTVYVLVPKNAVQKKYPISVKAIYASKILEKTLELTVSCESVQPTVIPATTVAQTPAQTTAAKPAATTTTVVTQPTTATTTTQPQVIVTPSQSQMPPTQYIKKPATSTVVSSSGEDSTFIMFFVVLEILLAIILIAAIILFRRK